jgi:hypothetical protein
MGIKDKFKAKWEEKDILCECCGKVKTKAKGFTRDNVKYLIWHKPTTIDYVVMAFMLLFIISEIAYWRDTQVCRDYVKERQSMIVNFSDISFDILNKSIQPIVVLYPYDVLNVTNSSNNSKDG